MSAFLFWLILLVLAPFAALLALVLDGVLADARSS